MATTKDHPGFKAIAAKIAAREGKSKNQADAILAASSRNASAKAKKKNPHLNRVKGKASPVDMKKAIAAKMGKK